MQIAITGASGLIGSALIPALRASGHEVLRLVRRPAESADELSWDPAGEPLDPGGLSTVDAVVHLAGVGIADKRWTEAHKRAVLDSRLQGTRTISAAIAAARPRPRVLLSASAVGWYGDTGDRIVDESAPAGEGFLADVVRQWEGATRAAADAGTRVVLLRTGLVCVDGDGILGRMMPLARLGLLSPLGSGRQYQPWISLADEVAAMQFLLDSDGVAGPVNLTGPVPVTNAELTQTLLHVCGRRRLAPRVPAALLRLGLGAMADEAVLAGQRAVPRVLEEAGYRFAHPTFEAAARWATGRSAGGVSPH
ncbi:MAG: TIGR01777 family oxidoreductase [Actinomycetota bacterium]|nr:TIGR01777 family oxidoreductase [Actinomycetota bacterium]